MRRGEERGRTEGVAGNESSSDTDGEVGEKLIDSETAPVAVEREEGAGRGMRRRDLSVLVLTG